MKFICPLIVVSNIERSRKFYEDLLDQKVKYDFGENVTFYGDFAIHLKSHFSELIDNKSILQQSNNFELYFENEAINELVVKLEKEEVSFVHEMREQPWRQKVVRFYDPDGHIIEVGEPMDYLPIRLKREGLNAQEIADAIGMPIDFVNQSLA